MKYSYFYAQLTYDKQLFNMVKQLPLSVHNAAKMFKYLPLNVPKLIFTQKSIQKPAGKSFRELAT
jgi:hypothetical protein